MTARECFATKIIVFIQAYVDTLLSNRSALKIRTKLCKTSVYLKSILMTLRYYN